MGKWVKEGQGCEILTNNRTSHKRQLRWKAEFDKNIRSRKVETEEKKRKGKKKWRERNERWGKKRRRDKKRSTKAAGLRFSVKLLRLERSPSPSFFPFLLLRFKQKEGREFKRENFKMRPASRRTPPPSTSRRRDAGSWVGSEWDSVAAAPRRRIQYVFRLLLSSALEAAVGIEGLSSTGTDWCLQTWDHPASSRVAPSIPSSQTFSIPTGARARYRRRRRRRKAVEGRLELTSWTPRRKKIFVYVYTLKELSCI